MKNYLKKLIQLNQNKLNSDELLRNTFLRKILLKYDFFEKS